LADVYDIIEQLYGNSKKRKDYIELSSVIPSSYDDIENPSKENVDTFFAEQCDFLADQYERCFLIIEKRYTKDENFHIQFYDGSSFQDKSLLNYFLNILGAIEDI
jgi:hypothetical protein